MDLSISSPISRRLGLWSMRVAGLAFVIGFALILPGLSCGCSLVRRAAPAAPAVTPAFGASSSAAVAAAAGAQQTASAADDERLTRLSANVSAASDAVDRDQKPVAQGELAVAKGRLADVKPDPAEVAAAAERRALVESGKAAEARSAYESAATKARDDAARIADLQAAADAARTKADRLIAELIASAEKNRLANQKAIDAAVERANNQVLAGQVSKLNWAGAICMAVAIGSLGLGFAVAGLAALSRVGPLALVSGLGALICFGAAQIVGAWWFLYATGGAIAVLVTWGGVWFYRHQKAGDLAKELATRSAKVAAVAQEAVPVLDAAYEKAEQPIKDWLDAHVFGELSRFMGPDTKATVHEIRADATRQNPTG